MRKRKYSYPSHCMVCGKEIKYTSIPTHNMCIFCKNTVMSEWAKISFEERVMILKLKGVKFDV